MLEYFLPIGVWSFRPNLRNNVVAAGQIDDGQEAAWVVAPVSDENKSTAMASLNSRSLVSFVGKLVPGAALPAQTSHFQLKAIVMACSLPPFTLIAQTSCVCGECPVFT